MSKAFVFLVLVVLLVAAGPSAAPQQTPTFRVGTEIVPFDFLAFDDAGRPVTDLKPSEIVLKIDKQGREIRSLQYYKLSPTSAEVPHPVPALAPPFGTNDTATPSRTVVIVVDHAQVPQGQGKGALDAAGRFLDRLAPRDRVGVVTVPEGRLEVDLTTNHARVQTRLGEIIGHGQAATGGISHISIDEALTVLKETRDPDKKFTEELVRRECQFAPTDPDASFCQARVVQDALNMAREIERQTHASFMALRDFLGGLSGTAGPTTVVYIASSLVEFEETRLDLEDVQKAAARARVQMFVVQPHEPAVDATARNEPTRSNDPLLKLTGLEDLAGVTGGEFFRLTGLGDSVFTRIADEMAGYYLLGFEPKKSEQDGKAHGIQLTTTRKGVKLRARPAFYYDDPARARVEPMQLDALLRDAATFRGLPLRATAFAFRDRDPRYLKVVAAVEPLEPGATIVSTSFALISATGQNAASWKEEGANLVLDRPILSSAAVPPGDYRLRVAALDSTGRRGTVDFEFAAKLQDAPPLKAGTLMTGVMQSSNFRPRLIFDASAAAVTGYLELYGVMPPGSTPSVDFEIAARPNTPALATGTGRVLGTSEPDRFVATGSVNLDKLPPGDYVLRALLSVNGQPAGVVSRTIKKE